MKNISLLLLFSLLITSCDRCCDEDIPFLSTETMRSYIPYTEGEVIVFLENGLDSIPMVVSADQVDSSGFGSPVYGGCALYNTEMRELRLRRTDGKRGFSVDMLGSQDTVIRIGDYTSAQLLIDNTGEFLCRPAFDGQHADVICLDSFWVSGKLCQNVIRHIRYSSDDTLYYAPEFGILKVCKQGGNRLERLW